MIRWARLEIRSAATSWAQLELCGAVISWALLEMRGAPMFGMQCFKCATKGSGHFATPQILAATTVILGLIFYQKKAARGHRARLAGKTMLVLWL